MLWRQLWFESPLLAAATLLLLFDFSDVQRRISPAGAPVQRRGCVLRLLVEPGGREKGSPMTKHRRLVITFAVATVLLSPAAAEASFPGDNGKIAFVREELDPEASSEERFCHPLRLGRQAL